MKKNEILEIILKIDFDRNSGLPKYKQIVEVIIQQILYHNIKIDDKLPSIYTVSNSCELSHHTIEKAYAILKERKIITAIHGKGHYINMTELISKNKVLFLVNKLSSYKLMIYNSFINAIGENFHTDLQIYHCKESLFLEILDKAQGLYDYYIIIPHFQSENLKYLSYSQKIIDSIAEIPNDRLLILDTVLDTKELFFNIYQDYENDIYSSLKSGLLNIEKYKKLLLVYPEDRDYPYPKGIISGFEKFCSEFTFDFEVLNHIKDDINITKNTLFLVIDDTDLIDLIKLIHKKYILGKDIGLIAYNDSPLKKLLGITVISTDFMKMGQTAAQMIIEKNIFKIKNTFELFVRNSI